MWTKFVFSMAVMAAVTGSVGYAACGDKITIANGSVITVPPIISWDASIEESMLVAQIKKKPFAIYFVCKDDCKVVGENSDAIKNYMQANNNSLPSSVVDVPKIVTQVRELGVGTFVKIPMTKENRALAEKYAGESNTMVICSPTGEKITSIKCTADVVKAMETTKKDLAVWQGAK